MKSHTVCLNLHNVNDEPIVRLLTHTYNILIFVHKKSANKGDNEQRKKTAEKIFILEKLTVSEENTVNETE